MKKKEQEANALSYNRFKEGLLIPIAFNIATHSITAITYPAAQYSSTKDKLPSTKCSISTISKIINNNNSLYQHPPQQNQHQQQHHNATKEDEL